MRALRLFHTSDTHLGHAQYPRTDANGLNQREQDHAAAFHATIDAAVAAKPDLFIHAGDLFDGVRPSNRALAHALEGFLKLSRAGIPTVLIAGNHEHPKLRETGSPFRLLAHLPGIRPVYQGQRETITLDVPDVAEPVRIHAVPQCADNDALAAEIEAIRPPEGGLDLLVVHGAVATLKAFSHAEFNEQTLQPSWFDDRFDYVALGHYHGVQQVAERAWYCGAPERVSMAEAGQEKGYLDVHVEPGRAHTAFRPLAGRLYVDLPELDADGLSAPDVAVQARRAVAAVPPGSVARLRIARLDPSLRGSLDLRSIHEAGRHLVHLDLSRLSWRDNENQTAAAGGQGFGATLEEFEAFAAKTPMPGLDRDAVLRLARQALAKPAEAAP